MMVVKYFTKMVWYRIFFYSPRPTGGLSILMSCWAEKAVKLLSLKTAYSYSTLSREEVVLVESLLTSMKHHFMVEA